MQAEDLPHNRLARPDRSYGSASAPIAQRLIRVFLLCLVALPMAAQNPLYIDLSGEWRTTTSDDPSYANTDLDDSGWDAWRLPSPTPDFRTKRWLRRAFDVPAGTGAEELVLTIGGFRQWYEVYLNGVRVGSTLPGQPKELSYPRAHLFAVRPGTVRAGARNVIAIKALSNEGVSGLYAPLLSAGPFLLTARANAPVNAPMADRDARLRLGTPAVVAVVLFCANAVFIFLLWMGSRSDATLPGLTVLLLIEAFGRFSEYAAILLDLPSGARLGVAPLFNFGPLVFVVLQQFQTARPRQLRTNILISAACLGVVLAGSSGPYRAEIAEILVYLLLLLEIAWLVKRWGLYEGKRLILITLTVITAIWTTRFPVPFRIGMTSREIGGFYIRSSDTSLVVASFVLVILMVRKLIDDRREKERLASEFEAARAVQQLLLAGAETKSELFQVEAVYQPAQEVGGDFHWSRTAADGSMLIAVGDVSGKGLQAALQVSVVIGILRNEKSLSPAAVLKALNEGLATHTGGGFVTCCCARFEPGGGVTIANAGHPAPYSGGVEVAVEAGLPLGVVAGVEYGETTARGEQFTFVSDGVIEAANARGELFGFERTASASRGSAREIAEAARAWGQNDDITVVTVRRAA